MSLKYFLLVLTAVALASAAVIFIVQERPDAGKYLWWMAGVLMGMLMLITLLKPIVQLVLGRATGILSVNADKSGRGVHIFSYRIQSGGEGLDNIRDIRYNFVLLESGNLFSYPLFSHDMSIAEGRSGWGDFVSFEETVLPSEALQKSMFKLAKALPFDPVVGDAGQNEGEEWSVYWTDKQISVRQRNSRLGEGFEIVCQEIPGEKVLWRRVI